MANKGEPLFPIVKVKTPELAAKTEENERLREEQAKLKNDLEKAQFKLDKMIETDKSWLSRCCRYSSSREEDKDWDYVPPK